MAWSFNWQYSFTVVHFTVSGILGWQNRHDKNQWKLSIIDSLQDFLFVGTYILKT